MSDEPTIVNSQPVNKTRRSVMKTAAQVAVTAPAVGLLLSAGSMPAMAAATYGTLGAGNQFGDDTTFSDNPANGNGDAYPNGPSDDLVIGDDTTGTHAT